jgi:hypothetical protein
MREQANRVNGVSAVLHHVDPDAAAIGTLRRDSAVLIALDADVGPPWRRNWIGPGC